MQEHQLTEVAEVSKMPKLSLGVKAKLYDELKRFLMIFAYLWLVFLVFLVHEWIVLADNHIGFKFMASLRSTPWSFPRSCSHCLQCQASVNLAIGKAPHASRPIGFWPHALQLTNLVAVGTVGGGVR